MHAMDDFTIILFESADMISCELKVYEGLDRLWQMVERYKMTAPIAITVVDKAARDVRTIRGVRTHAGAWQLENTSFAAAPPLEGEVEFPLTIKVQDANGNILKMRLQLDAARPEVGHKKVDPR